MPMSKVPEVGKFLVKQAASTALYRWYEPGGKIVRIAGNRVYYTAQDGSEKFTHEYACVCDTQAEVDQLLAFSAAEKGALEAHMLGIAERDTALQSTLTKGGKPVAVKPVKAAGGKPQDITKAIAEADKGTKAVQQVKAGASTARRTRTVTKAEGDAYLAGIMAKGTADRLAAEEGLAQRVRRTR